MKCTDCGDPIKPVVALDIDGTLGDYHGHFLNFAAAYLGTDPQFICRYGGNGPFKRWFCLHFEVDERTWYDIKLAYRQGAQKRSMPAFRYAADLTHRVRGAGAELWLTTTRPYLRLDNVDPDTRHWLDRHGIGYDHLMYDEDKYPLLAGRVAPERVVAVLDDEPEQYRYAVATFGPDIPILRRQTYNCWAGGAFRFVAEDLEEATAVIINRIKEWPV